MPTSLSKDHRKLLESTTADARVLAEAACRAALENLAVHEKEYRPHMSVEQRKLRNRLRARGRALGDTRDQRAGVQDIRHLTELAAYEHWHRVLFTRFLTENHLLITDETHGSVPITLEECEELAPELGARDGQDLACRFASRTLPGVFRRDDPVLDLPIALNDQVELRKHLAALPSECFRADDALGWTYQFWQAQRKYEINSSGKKIGADELAPVTQLFTEDYMVEFLLHNTLGAWWVGKLGPIKAANEEEARARAGLPALDGVPAISWTYLRFMKDETAKTWLPAAGSFGAWPKSARLIRLLDPCGGSGHFLVFAFLLLVRLRMEEEKLNAQTAVVAVLKDNVHGLELDERCTQIAAFNVALTAWKLAGYQALPRLNLACSGLGINEKEEAWIKLADKDDHLRGSMKTLYGLFHDSPILGSLIDPKRAGGSLFVTEFEKVQPLLEIALGSEIADEATLELAVAAQGLVRAARILAGTFTLVATNVPYLYRGKQVEQLKEYCDRFHADAKTDLATCFVDRCLSFCESGGTTALVTPQNWLFLGAYRKLRERLLRQIEWEFIVRLGPRAFETIGGEVVNVALLGLSRTSPIPDTSYAGLDASEKVTPTEKQMAIKDDVVVVTSQADQLKMPDARIGLEELSKVPLLDRYAQAFQGISPADYPHYGRHFWELPAIQGWHFWQSTVEKIVDYGGRDLVLWWNDDLMEAVKSGQAYLRGQEGWDKRGVVVSQMNDLPVTLYTGERFDTNCAVMVPLEESNLQAIWAFCSSPEFNSAVRRIDKTLKVTNATLVKVPFDLAHWQEVAQKKNRNCLPPPHSDDPTQWIHSGYPSESCQPLHIAVARLLGYRWPRQTGSNFRDCAALGSDGLEKFADEDGIVCLPPLNREQPAAARLRQLLTSALGTFDERALIACARSTGSKSKSLEDWLRDEFFEQHTRLFHDRPFIWHLWDGRPDGFHALVNYHRLDHANLQKLTYSYLGNWIQQQADDTKADKPGAAERLGAARALQAKFAAILEGEVPLDIFVRWKSLGEQSRGWHPDLNDGVRQNIRPFLLVGDVGKKGAGLFRSVPLKLKDKDRGTEIQCPKKEYPWFWCEEEPRTDPSGGKEFIGNRWNSVHLTLEMKQKAKG